MPTFQHGKTTSVYLDEFDMSGYLSSTDVTHTQETAETTVYGASSRAFIASQKVQAGAFLFDNPLC